MARIIKEFLFENGDYYKEYLKRSFVIGRNVTVIKPSESYNAKVLDSNPDFSLKIEHDGIIEKLFTGEISIKLNQS